MSQFDFEELKKTYPKAVAAINKYFQDRHLKNLEEIKEMFGEKDIEMPIMEASDFEFMISNVLENSPRMLFDFLDAQKIFISINKVVGADLWVYDISNRGNGQYTSRQEAERAAIVEALNQLESL